MRQLAGEHASDELFGLAPEEFVAARDELARRLKREGDAETAARVKALRRPTLSAWAVNQLARARGRDLEPLLAAGERLRSAHQAALAGGGAAELRAAARAEREAVAGLVEAALELLRQADHPTTDTTRDRVAATLHAAAADPAAADLVRHGRLTADLDPAGFGTTPEADDAEDLEAAGGGPRRRGAGTGPGRGGGPGGRGAAPGRKDAAARGRQGAAAEQDRRKAGPEDAAGQDAGKAGAGADEPGGEDDVAAARARRADRADDPAKARARRSAAVAVRDEARKRARLAADQAVLATRQAERLGRLADQAEREAARARTTAAAAIEAASAARERAARAAKELRQAEDRIPADR